MDENLLHQLRWGVWHDEWRKRALAFLFWIESVDHDLTESEKLLLQPVTHCVSALLRIHCPSSEDIYALKHCCCQSWLRWRGGRSGSSFYANVGNLQWHCRAKLLVHPRRSLQERPWSQERASYRLSDFKERNSQYDRRFSQFADRWLSNSWWNSKFRLVFGSAWSWGVSTASSGMRCVGGYNLCPAFNT